MILNSTVTLEIPCVCMQQYLKVCELFKISPKKPFPITCDDGIIAGFFAADGSILIQSSWNAAKLKEKLLSLHSNHGKNAKPKTLKSCFTASKNWNLKTPDPLGYTNKVQKILKLL